MRERQVDWKFKKALSAAGITQRTLGELVGIHHTLLSMYAQGRYVLDAIERKKIARVLKMPESEIFSD